MTEQRTCIHCQNVKSLDQFSIKSEGGKRTIRYVCQVCYLEQRRRLRAGATAEQKAARQEYRRRYEASIPADRAERKLARRRALRALRREQRISEYMCRDCHMETVSRIGIRCKACARASVHYTVKPAAERRARDIQYAANEAKALRAKQAVRQVRDPGNYMEIGHGEFMSYAATCWRCHKKIVINGMCYTCATGRERVILRRSEQAEAVV